MDAYFEIRPESTYRLGFPHEGAHEKECLYRSPVVVQDLNPKFASVAIDLQRLCNMNLDTKILLDFWDRDRFSKNDFMSYIETTVRELLDQAGKQQGMPLKPPPAPHQQAVGELWVDKAVLNYPVVYISELSGTLTVANAKLTAAKCFAMLCQGGIKKSTEINLTNEVGMWAPCIHTQTHTGAQAHTHTQTDRQTHTHMHTSADHDPPEDLDHRQARAVPQCCCRQAHLLARELVRSGGRQLLRLPAPR